MDLSSSTIDKLYSAALKASQPNEAGKSDADDKSSADSFVSTVTAATKETAATIKRGEETAQDMMAGKADAHSVVEALAATEMALEMAVSVRDRVVQAYQEILRMPV
ncbi:MAG: flagellar hook-basal body complex protein FliE [Neomegalonema sp.]|nr:flagellar hook-basal body complex protein FliE [Neomegalonema sp.]